jgi:hypothetical protein
MTSDEHQCVHQVHQALKGLMYCFGEDLLLEDYDSFWFYCLMEPHITALENLLKEDKHKTEA